MRARNVSQRKGKEGRGKLAALAGPARYAARDVEKKTAACWAEEAERLQSAGWAERPKVEKEEDFYFHFLFQYFKCIFK
jgi:hypothetical protein